jgi:hypothetical protein
MSSWPFKLHLPTFSISHILSLSCVVLKVIQTIFVIFKCHNKCKVVRMIKFIAVEVQLIPRYFEKIRVAVLDGYPGIPDPDFFPSQIPDLG